jgi:hypothetical protein
MAAALHDRLASFTGQLLVVLSVACRGRRPLPRPPEWVLGRQAEAERAPGAALALEERPAGGCARTRLWWGELLRGGARGSRARVLAPRPRGRRAGMAGIAARRRTVWAPACA